MKAYDITGIVSLKIKFIIETEEYVEWIIIIIKILQQTANSTRINSGAVTEYRQAFLHLLSPLKTKCSSLHADTSQPSVDEYNV